MSTTNCLVVDDSRLSRMMIQKFILKEHPDWNIDEAADGQEALDKAADGDYQIFTIDFNMPGINGIEVAKTLRPKFPSAKIVLLTANVQDSIRRRAAAMGIDFIAKPITEEKISGYVA